MFRISLIPAEYAFLYPRRRRTAFLIPYHLERCICPLPYVLSAIRCNSEYACVQMKIVNRDKRKQGKRGKRGQQPISPSEKSVAVPIFQSLSLFSPSLFPPIHRRFTRIAGEKCGLREILIYFWRNPEGQIRCFRKCLVRNGDWNGEGMVWADQKMGPEP